MKALLFGAAIALVFAGGASAQTSRAVKGYVKSSGTYVAPHRATTPNSTVNDNYSTKPNYNPYTGKAGTKSPDYGYKPAKAPKKSY